MVLVSGLPLVSATFSLCKQPWYPRMACNNKRWTLIMKIRLLLILAFLTSGTANSQVLNPQKDLAFGQLAAGGGYETVLIVTNRGISSYSGIMKLYQNSGKPWNPLINGVTPSSGKLPVSLSSGETKSYKITLPGGVEAGFAIIVADTMDQKSFIEGNLTYYVHSAGTISESVGISPSSEFYRATLTSDDMSTLAMALVNLNATPAVITLKAYSEANTPLGSPVTLPDLGPNYHMAEYIWQRIAEIKGMRGRVEIQSNVPIMGIAITDINGLFSSLPLSAAPCSYDFSTTISGIPLNGELGMWIEGPYIKGYLRVTHANNAPLSPPGTFLFHGVYANGILRAGGVGQLAILGNVDLEVFAELKNFSLSTTAASGTIRVTANGQSETNAATFTKVF